MGVMGTPGVRERQFLYLEQMENSFAAAKGQGAEWGPEGPRGTGLGAAGDGAGMLQDAAGQTSPGVPAPVHVPWVGWMWPQ